MLGPKGGQERQIQHSLHNCCTFDFCEQSQINFTSISQRHESLSCKPGSFCEPLEGLFSRKTLEDAFERNENGPTAWQFNGALIIEEGQKYMAISHVWSDGTGAGAWDGLKVNRCLYHFFRKLAREFGCKGIWWDIMCLPGKKALREKALANMHLNYEKAEITLVHDCFLRNLPWISAETACIAILMSPWFSRGWTALELLKTRKGTVKFVFKGDGRPLIKDLDDDILANERSSQSHKLASGVIEKLRSGSICEIDDLLLTLGSRHTSWTRDMAIISALLVGAQITGKEQQQDIYQAVLRKLKGFCHAHLFHNLPTVSNGSSWSPVSLLSLPRLTSKTPTAISIGECGEAEGFWKIVQLKNMPSKDQYDWKTIHPFIAIKLRSCLNNDSKSTNDYILLVEPDANKIKRALLVKSLGEKNRMLQCCFVGAVYFDSPLEGCSGPGRQVAIANGEEIEVAVQDNHKNISEIQVYQGAIEDKQSSPIETKEHKAPPKVLHTPARAQVRTYPALHHPEAANTGQGGRDPLPREIISSSTPINDCLMEAIKSGNEERIRQLIIEGADIGFQDKGGRTPTSLAALYGHYEAVMLLLEQYDVNYDCMDCASQISHFPSNVNADEKRKAVVEKNVENFTSFYNSKDKEGNTPLLLALENGYKDVALLLLEWYETQYKHKIESTSSVSPLVYACMHGYQDVAQLLVKSGSDPDLKGGKYARVGETEIVMTPLLWAAKGGYEGIVHLLLKTGKVDVNSSDDERQTPLFWAARKGHKEVVQLLLEKGTVDVDPKNKYSETPLLWAAFEGHTEIVQLLLNTGKVDVNSKNEKDIAPLLGALLGGQKEVFGLLLKTDNVDVNTKDDRGQTPLIKAAEFGHKDIVQLLLEIDAVDVDSKSKRSETPLSKAAEAGYKDIVVLLIETGKVDVNSQNYANETPLSMAAKAGYTGIVKLLLDSRKVDVNCMNNYKETALFHAVKSGYTEIFELIFYMDNVDIDSKNVQGLTPLCLAAMNGNNEIFELLMKTHRVRIELKSVDGYTPLSHAASHGHEKIVRLLLKTGQVDVNSKDNYGSTPLIKAASGGYKDVVPLLLKTKEVRVDLKDVDYRTALWWAASKGHIEVVQQLLDTGKVYIHSKDYFSETPLSTAERNGHEEIAQLLRNAPRSTQIRGIKYLIAEIPMLPERFWNQGTY
ncbi:MAG: hypothetical protein M1829_000974 [Trizodia sp. TS-e1964]|nr:MAG: hypothetical protein M1829_000974 [Trizodia sp. TS-e1964]